MNKKCLFCNNDATKLCDSILGFEAKDAVRKSNGDVEQLITSKDAKMFTCDAPICNECAKQVGVIHIRNIQGDSVDYCPYHQVNYPPVGMNVIFDKEAVRIRANLHQEMRRSRIKILAKSMDIKNGN